MIALRNKGLPETDLSLGTYLVLGECLGRPAARRRGDGATRGPFGSASRCCRRHIGGWPMFGAFWERSWSGPAERRRDGDGWSKGTRG